MCEFCRVGCIIIPLHGAVALRLTWAPPGSVPRMAASFPGAARKFAYKLVFNDAARMQLQFNFVRLQMYTDSPRTTGISCVSFVGVGEKE
jgi:hypothetical protein